MKIPPPPHSEFRSPDHPARSESLYRIRYSGPPCFPLIIGFQVMPFGVVVVQRLKYWGVVGEALERFVAAVSGGELSAPRDP